MRKILVLTAIVGLLAVACSSGSEGGEAGPRRGSGGGRGLGEAAGALQAFDDCDQLTAYAAEQATAWYSGDGSSNQFFAAGRAAGAEDEADMATESAAPVPSTVPADEFSTTNNQEAGVDEADVVKTDGELVLTTTDGSLRVLDATGTDPRLVGSLALPEGGPHELLLHDDRLLVLSSGSLTIPPEQQQDGELPGMWMATTVLTEVDLSDPAEPTVVSTQQVDGSYRTARSSGGTARIVLTADPVTGGPMPIFTDEGTFDEDAVEARTADEWLPATTVVDEDGDLERTPLVDCTDVSRPAESSPIGGAGTVSVLSIDLTQPLGDLQAVGVMGSAEFVYASSDNLYLAGTLWGDRGGSSTEIHQLTLDGSAPASYVASGTVAGRPLNQFAFSEHDGRLRVATTEDNGGGGDVVIVEEGTSDSAITVLERSGDQLDEVGRVDGMGQGEQIYAVRFLGDQAYVVTFRQTDPLYTVDLSDPRAPAVVGELKIPGYSAYLHPVGDDLLLGVGQDADEETGRTRGTQVSLFDVSDLATPVRLQHFTMPSGSSDVEYDHRAFLWWAAENLAVVPHNGYDRGWSYNAALALEVTPEGIVERGSITHQDDAPGDDTAPGCPPGAECLVPVDVTTGGGYIARSLVVNRDQLWTVSDAGVQISDVDTLTDEGWISFAG